MTKVSDKRAPWFKFYASDFLGSTSDMTPAQVGAHMRLLAVAWEREGLPTDRARLLCITGHISDDELEGVLERWRVKDGRLVNLKQERVRSEMFGVHARRSAAGKRGAEQRWQSDGKAMANAWQSDSKPMANGMANAWQTDGMTRGPDDQMTREPETQRTNNLRGTKSATSTCAGSGVTWDAATGLFGNIDEAQRSRWAAAYPAVDLDQAIAAAGNWLMDNPTRRKKNLARFLSNWMARTQERGGSKRTVSFGSPRTIDDIPPEMRF